MHMLTVILAILATGPRTGIPVNPATRTADIQLFLANTFWAYGSGSNQRAMGLDAMADGTILGSNNLDLKIYGYHPATGALLLNIPLDPGNTKCFGVAIDQNSPSEWPLLTTDWTDSDLYYSVNWGLSWTQLPDPTGADGRGLDFDGTHYWLTGGTAQVIRLTPGGASTVFPTPEIPGQLSGITVMPHMGNTLVAVTAYTAQGIWFYQYTGTDLTCLGYAQLPFSNGDILYGLAYNAFNDCIYISYQGTVGESLISQMEYSMEMSLAPATWGAIKAALY